MTEAETLANVLLYARGTGQTTMLCQAARKFQDPENPHVRACVVTWTAREAHELSRTFGVEAHGFRDSPYAFAGQRGVLYLIDNHVMQELGREARELHNQLARVVEVFERNERIHAAELHALQKENRELRREATSATRRYADLQVVRARRERRRRKRRSK